MLILHLLPLLASLVTAQQNVLVNGNSQLPQCAQQCALLQQANQACVATATPQAAWTCFCQSAYLTQLYSTAVGVCDTACTDTTQNAQVSTWYKSNCGTDYGVSEHAADTANAAATTTAGAAAAAGTTASGSSNSGSNSGSSSSGNSGSGSSSSSSSSSSSGKDWWSGHYQWIIMVIVLAIGFSLLAWLGVWLKRRHDRKQDTITGGFNAGITERSAPLGGIAEKNASGTLTTASATERNSGRNSPARTREAYMPYGYGYANSESRVGSTQAVDRPMSPLAASVMSNSQDHGGLGPWPAEPSAKGVSRAG